MAGYLSNPQSGNQGLLKRRADQQAMAPTTRPVHLPGPETPASLASQQQQLLGVTHMPGYSMGQDTSINARRQYTPDADQSPENLYNWMLQDQYSDYQQRFQPFERASYANVMDPDRTAALHGQVLQQATTDANAAADRGAARRETNRRSFNIRQTPEEAKITARKNHLSRATAGTSARNTARGHLYDRDTQLLMG